MIHRNPKSHSRIISTIESSDNDVLDQNKRVLYSLAESGKKMNMNIGIRVNLTQVDMIFVALISDQYKSSFAVHFLSASKPFSLYLSPPHFVLLGVIGCAINRVCSILN